MKLPIQNRLTRAAIPFCFAVLASLASADQAGTAKGTLTVDDNGGSLSGTITHAYYITGPDSFDASNIQRIIVFTADDQTDAIAACADKSCAELSTVDGLKIDLSIEDMTQWSAHVGSVQRTGISGNGLTLRKDTPEHLAGTFRLKDSGVTADIEFDAKLIKAFDR